MHRQTNIQTNRMHKHFSTLLESFKKYIKCKRFESKRIDTENGVRLEDKVLYASTLEVVGNDLAGPFYLSDGTKM